MSGLPPALLLLVVVAQFCLVVAPVPPPPERRSGDWGRKGRIEWAKEPEADLTVNINGRKSALLCGDAKAEARRRGRGLVEENPASEKACKSLAYVDDFAQELKPPAPGSDKCLDEPVREKVVTIEGRFKGRRVRFGRTYRNICQLNEVAPDVFNVGTPRPEARCLAGAC